jgi:hypothetical protein
VKEDLNFLPPLVISETDFYLKSIFLALTRFSVRIVACSKEYQCMIKTVEEAGNQ